MTQQENLRLALRGLSRRQKWAHEISYRGTRLMRPARRYYHKKQPNALMQLALMTGLTLAVVAIFFIDIVIKLG